MAVQALSAAYAQNFDSVSWSSLATGDTGAPFEVLNARALAGAVQVTGTFSGATVTLQCSNDGTNYVAVKDVSGSDIALTAAGMKEFSTAARYLRPSVASGTGTGLVATLCLRG